MDVGEKIRKVKRQKEIKQVALAQILGLDQSYVSRIESNEIKLDLDILQKIANALDVSIVDLFPDEISNQFINCTHSGYFNCNITQEINKEIVELLKLIIDKMK